MKHLNQILILMIFIVNQGVFASNFEIDTRSYVTDEQLKASALAKDHDDGFIPYMNQFNEKKDILKAFKEYIKEEIDIQQNRALVVFQTDLSNDQIFHDCGSGGAYFGYCMYFFHQDIDRRAKKIHSSLSLDYLYYKTVENNQLMKCILQAANRRKNDALEFLTFLSSQESYVPFYNWAHKHKPDLLKQREKSIEKHGSITIKDD